MKCQFRSYRGLIIVRPLLIKYHYSKLVCLKYICCSRAELGE